jgi:hypothetical protein
MGHLSNLRETYPDCRLLRELQVEGTWTADDVSTWTFSDLGATDFAAIRRSTWYDMTDEQAYDWLWQQRYGRPRTVAMLPDTYGDW